jgi:hypothetical protein
MAIDINDPKYPQINYGTDEEAHEESIDESMKSNVIGHEHPFFTANGVIATINSARNMSNTKEQLLSGKIPQKVFEDISDAARKTKVPYDLLLFACDWENDMTSRSDASDASGIAQKIISYVPELRNSLGRDPMNAELFMAHCVNGASQVKTILDNSVNKPEDEAQSAGTKKDDLVLNKKRGEKTQKRTNRELYDYFYKRAGANAKVLYHEDLGKDKYSV